MVGFEDYNKIGVFHPCVADDFRIMLFFEK
jgi:hypothetical protein